VGSEMCIRDSPLAIEHSDGTWTNVANLYMIHDDLPIEHEDFP
jgi:hypothetical protein